MVLVSALFALSAGGTNHGFVFVAYVPVFVFWGIDGYFLREERKYRRLYDEVRMLEEDAIDFSMDTSKFTKNTSWAEAVISTTLIPFHGVLLIAVLVVMFIKIS